MLYLDDRPNAKPASTPITTGPRAVRRGIHLLRMPTDPLGPIFRRLVRGSEIFLGLAMLILGLPGLADATTPPALPRPIITGPTSAFVQAKPLVLTFSYPNNWSEQGPYSLWYWAQDWGCAPGSDTLPTDHPEQLEPWAGGQILCQLDNDKYLGLDRAKSSGQLWLPVKGGKVSAGTWYARVRLAWEKQDGTLAALGPWSTWHRVTVATKLQVPAHSGQIGLMQPAAGIKSLAAPPDVQTPKEHQLFVNTGPAIRVRAVSLSSSANKLHPVNYSLYEYVLDWKRAEYHTQENNANWRKAHPGNFPTTSGQVSQFAPWTAPSAIQAIKERPGTSRVNVPFSDLSPNSFEKSYLYEFRVREHRKASSTYGPWSQWREFIVSDLPVNQKAPIGAMNMKLNPQPQPPSGSSSQGSSSLRRNGIASGHKIGLAPRPSGGTVAMHKIGLAPRPQVMTSRALPAVQLPNGWTTVGGVLRASRPGLRLGLSAHHTLLSKLGSGGRLNYELLDATGRVVKKISAKASLRLLNGDTLMLQEAAGHHRQVLLGRLAVKH